MDGSISSLSIEDLKTLSTEMRERLKSARDYL